MGFLLRRGAGIDRLVHIVRVNASGIDDVAAHAVVACRSVGNLPRIDAHVLVVLYESFHAAVKMEQVGIAHLLPAAPALRHGQKCANGVCPSALTSRPAGVAVQWITKYFSFFAIVGLGMG